jgi:SAM-dependent methyltransferase
MVSINPRENALAAEASLDAKGVATALSSVSRFAETVLWRRRERTFGLMTGEVPQLFDPVKAELALQRAERRGIERFLLDRVLEDLAERLQPVLRRFSAVLDLGVPAGDFPTAARLAGKLADGADIRRLSPDDAPPGEPACDLVLAGMVFHRVNDLPGLLIRLRRALNADGLMLAVFPGGDTLHELRDCLIRAESMLTGNAVMRVAPMIDVRAGGQLLQRAGFALPVADSETIVVRYSSLMRLVADLRSMGASGSLLYRVRGQPALNRAIFLKAAEVYATEHADPDGKLRVTFEFIWLSGWAPHESQQKPLKPGSAKARLADALNMIGKGGEKP